MKITVFLFLSISLSFFAQENKKIEFDSKILSELRYINIHLPASYSKSEKSYPVIYTLDGEYTKLTLNGTLDYYSYWDKTPECIVVSIEQNYLDTIQKKYKRWLDCSYSWATGLPNDKGILFKEFVSIELIPFIDSSFRTTTFRTIIGHSFTANFVNYFLIDKEPLFTGFVSISPYFATNGLDSIKKCIINLKKPIFYYVACGEKDLSGHIESVNEFNNKFSKIENENFNYKMFDMKNNQATHFTIFPIAIPDAIEHLFSSYSSIGIKEFNKILKTENKINYLKERYEQIQSIYGVKIPIRESDLNTITYAISKKKEWEKLKQIAELTIEIYPESFLGYWTMGEYFEKLGDFTNSLIQYNLGFSKLGEDTLNIADFQKEINRVKNKIKK